MTKTVLIGCGNSGRKIAAELSNFGADIVGFCDLSIDRAEELAKKYSGEAYSDYRKMIAEKTPDAALSALRHTARMKFSCARSIAESAL